MKILGRIRRVVEFRIVFGVCKTPCDLPAGFAVSDNLVTLFHVMKKDVTELQLMPT